MNAAPSLAPATLPADTIGVAYNQTITASGGTGTLTLAVSNVQGQIAGLTVPASGTGSLVVSGTPTAAGTETFTVTATDSVGATTTTELQHYGQFGSLEPRAGDAAGRHDRRGLQPDDHRQRRHRHGHLGREQHSGPNRRLDRSGQRHGKPGSQRHAHGRRDRDVHPHRHRFRWAQQRTTNYSITVNPAALSLAPATLPADTIGVAYNQTITASGGTGTVTLAVSNIQGPIAGLTVPASGTGSLVVSGTPTAAGTETFTLTATDSRGRDHYDQLQHYGQSGGLEPCTGDAAGRHDRRGLQPDDHRQRRHRHAHAWP